MNDERTQDEHDRWSAAVRQYGNVHLAGTALIRRLDAAVAASERAMGVLAAACLEMKGKKPGDPIEAHVVGDDGELRPRTITVGRSPE